MLKITVIIGLPGSGKTELAKKLHMSMNMEEQSLIIDDFSRAVDDRSLAISGKIKHIIITDPNACLVDRDEITSRLLGLYGSCHVSYIAFENDVDAAWANVERRNDGRLISKAYLKTLALHYTPEEFTTNIRPVWRLQAVGR